MSSTGRTDRPRTARHGDNRRGLRATEYETWAGMNARCHQKRNKLFPYYGGRGIFVAPEWRGAGGYARFLAHVGRKPGPSYSIERIFNGRGYVPGNVRWATKKDQARNRRSTLRVSYRGVNLPLTEWCERRGLRYKTVWFRLKKGWTVEDALEIGL